MDKKPMELPEVRGVLFTQYLMPDGRQKKIRIERTPEIERLALAVTGADYSFEAEVLGDYQTVSFTCCKRGDQDENIAHELCQNGTAVPEAVDRLIRAAHAHLFPAQPGGGGP